MLQRVQTLYLIFIIALFVSMFFMNLAYVAVVESVDLSAINLSLSLGNVYSLAVLAALIIGLSMATIVLFKKGSLQLRLTVFTIILIIGFIGVEIYVVYQFFQASVINVANNVIVGVASLFPLPALLFAFMAFRGIAKDIFVLRSFNRMR